MADDIDRAQADCDFFLNQALAASKKKEPLHNGVCLFCAEKSEAKFCDRFCFEDFERLERAMSIAGKQA
jgi:hypothetical protein